MLPATLVGGVLGDPPIKQAYSSPDSLGGMLAHIHHVKDLADLRTDKEKRQAPMAAGKLYGRFLFYKNFVALQRSIIVPEGKTDSIYLRAAIRKLTAFHPRLGSITSGQSKSAIRVLNYTAATHSLLHLGRGTTQLHTFVESYRKSVTSFVHAPLDFPVIVLVDNDDGGRKLFGLAKAMSKTDITYASNEPFYYLGLNLYLVKTPEQAAIPHTSCMETLLDAVTLATVVGGKTFDPDKEHDAPGKYGKVVFATKVVEPNASTIDFSGFVPLLDRIVAVLDHHASLKAVPLAAAI